MFWGRFLARPFEWSGGHAVRFSGIVSLRSGPPDPDWEGRQHGSTEGWRTLFKVPVTTNTPMKTLLSRIMLSAASEMWRKEPTLSRYTTATAEHELNLAFHYAAELRSWFPYLNCDFDVAKNQFNGERPDIILHRRGSNACNFLVIEIKRARSRHDIPADLAQIRDRWFQGELKYRFGASLVLDEEQQTAEVCILSRIQPQQAEWITDRQRVDPICPPKFIRVRLGTLVDSVERLSLSELDDKSPLEQHLEQLILRLFQSAGAR